MKKLIFVFVLIVLTNSIVFFVACEKSSLNSAEESGSEFASQTLSESGKSSSISSLSPNSSANSSREEGQSSSAENQNANSSSEGLSSSSSQVFSKSDSGSNADNSESQTKTLGVWWWSDSLGDEYLNFVIERGVTEIYYSSKKFNEETASFITKANESGIKVYCLAGAYEWLDDATNLHNRIKSYEEYQKNFPTAKYSGIHLDIEPHQHPDWKGTDKTSPIRVELVQKLVDLAKGLKSTYSAISFDYDIPFWLDYEVVLDGKTKPSYEAMIDICDRIFIMSYRDSADAIYDISKEEIAYSKIAKKTIVLGIETYSEEGDNVSFWEEGEASMLEEMESLRLSYPNEFALSVHHAKKWYELANKE